jgi:hypothetical protein
MQTTSTTCPQHTLLHETDFGSPSPGWSAPQASGGAQWERTPEGLLLSAPGEGKVTVPAPGVHTRNGDTLALRFTLPEAGRGSLRFGFAGGFESATLVWISPRIDSDSRRRIGQSTSRCARSR